MGAPPGRQRSITQRRATSGGPGGPGVLQASRPFRQELCKSRHRRTKRSMRGALQESLRMLIRWARGPMSPHVQACLGHTVVRLGARRVSLWILGLWADNQGSWASDTRLGPVGVSGVTGSPVAAGRPLGLGLAANRSRDGGGAAVVGRRGSHGAGGRPRGPAELLGPFGTAAHGRTGRLLQGMRKSKGWRGCACMVREEHLHITITCGLSLGTLHPWRCGRQHPACFGNFGNFTPSVAQGCRFTGSSVTLLRCP